MENKGVNMLIVVLVFWLIAVAMIGLFELLEHQDALMFESMQAYEACVLSETGMNPQAYYAEQGEMLKCPVKRTQ